VLEPPLGSREIADVGDFPAFQSRSRKNMLHPKNVNARPYITRKVGDGEVMGPTISLGCAARFDFFWQISW
jgi:hypothetical protein